MQNVFYYSVFLQEGEYHAIDDSRQLSGIMMRYYRSEFSTMATKNQPVYSVPYHDGFGFGKMRILGFFQCK